MCAMDIFGLLVFGFMTGTMSVCTGKMFTLCFRIQHCCKALLLLTSMIVVGNLLLSRGQNELYFVNTRDINFLNMHTTIDSQKDVYLANQNSDLHCNNSQQVLDQPKLSKLSFGRFSQAAISTHSPHCSQLGKDVLEKDGSIVDAAVTVQLCIGVLSLPHAGIGGGFVMTVYARPRGESEKKMTCLIAKETAPQAATEDMFSRHNISSLYGGKAIAIPGEVAGLYEAWEKFGRLPWSDLVLPVAHLAETGFKMTSILAGIFHRQYCLHPESHHFLANFVKENGDKYAVGDTIKLPELARTLHIIAKEGRKGFYDGSLTDDILKDLQEQGSIITAADLAHYKPLWKDPVGMHLENGDMHMYGPPPPSSAAVVMFLMGILDGYNITQADREKNLMNGLTAHRVIEAMKFAFAKRSALADPDYSDVKDLLETLTSKKATSEIRQLISDVQTHKDIMFYQPEYDDQHDTGTEQITLYGDDGSAVALTSSLNEHFGSKVRGSLTGIIFNNHMDDFSTPGRINKYGFPASPSNHIAPGKRPMSSMSPLIILDGNNRVRMVLGSAGGSRIITAVTQSLVNHVWLQLPIHKALAAPRMHHQLFPNFIEAQTNIPKNLQDALQRRGHKIVKEHKHFYYGKVMAVSVTCSQCQDAFCLETCVHATTDYRVNEYSGLHSPAPQGF